MPRGPSEETMVFQVRVAMDRGQQLKDEAAAEGNRPVAHLLREIVEDYVSTYDLPLAMVESLETDRKRQKISRREYVRNMLDQRYREILGAKPPKK
jgi:hypothetical protein